jgi:hypothetical protein
MEMESLRKKKVEWFKNPPSVTCLSDTGPDPNPKPPRVHKNEHSFEL